MQALLTGIPGFGKTAHAIDWAFFQESDFSGMDKYVEGITGLDNVKCPHFLFPELREVKSPNFIPLSTVDANDEESEKYKPWLSSHPEYNEFLSARANAKHPIELWYLWAQKNSVIIIDEAQRFYRPRPAGSRVPLHITMLEYHRHFGVHFLFISQAPRLMDLHVRSLTEKHVHLDKTWKGGLKYEWVSCRDIDSKVDKKDAVKTAYSPPKHVFPLYKSSSLHLKVKHKIPMAIYVLAAAIPLFIALVWFAVHKVKADHQLTKPDNASSGLISISAASGVQAASSVAGVDTLYDFKPAVPGRPETAPAFNRLRQVVTMPVVSACIQSEQHCICYTQQGSRIADMSEDTCRFRVEQGHQFDPYSPPSQAAQSVPSGTYSGLGGGQAMSIPSMPPMASLDAGRMVANK